MQLIEAFNPMEVDPSQGDGSLPLGKHPVVITAAEVTATKDNTGGLVKFTLEVIDGPAKGSTGPYRLNLYNQSADAVRIARSQLSAICHVTGVFQLGADGKNLAALFGRPFVVNVVQQKDNAQYTEIRGVFDMNGNPPAKAGSGPAQGASAAPQGGAQAWGAQTGNGQQTGNGGGAAAAPGAGGGWGGNPAGASAAPAGGASTGWQQGNGAPAGGGAGPSWGAPR